MNLFRRTTTVCQRWTRQYPWNCRYISRSAEEFVSVSAKSVPDGAPAITFETLGLRPSVVNAMHAAFPNIRDPTDAQTRLIPAVLSGMDVLVTDDTGSGKSFGLLLSLLNKPRLRYKDKETGLVREKMSITSLFIVPHRDLAYQLYHWVQCISNAASSTSPGTPSISSIAQVLVRDGKMHLDSGLTALRSNPPHILIATPQAVMDVYRQEPEALPFVELSTVVVDEIDYLVETMPHKSEETTYWKTIQKRQAKLARHPGVTTELLDIICAQRKKMSEENREELVNEPYHMPQLVVSSASVRKHLSSHLFYESGWMKKKDTIIVHGSPKAVAPHSGLGGKDVKHSVLVVSGAKVTNIEEAVLTTPEGDHDATRKLAENSEGPPVAVDVSAEQRSVYEGKPSPFNPNALEAVAVAFALDVPSVALLVIRPEASVQRAVYDLRSMGVNAVALDVASMERGGAHLLSYGDTSDFKTNPTLLVCTRAMTRGIDFPELTHVFIMEFFQGKMSGQTVDEYLHIAGRVGRFGRGGRVITLVERGPVAGTETKDGRRTGGKEDAKMMSILKSIGCSPERFEYFD
ncbi:P-loop containing nucleoside triphosphate hydrolase protein [Armillaria mellea]|nr:P-loop containing nucleoside triphosphate hydrolase protein [Armillaria mellea]